ncbi:phosphoribosylglycinamide formyltransferase [Thermospira aquatica]|uniref:Phosphoribosylglycinamide formyltransferase n=1 Tax=Thermospira aquatica TaxID=2828656 RepID=A0AAX3BDL2_9SPIR|nr:phosphoribosylglycinamide formyltransferase [Thermospira aquatica]URA10377.1 phosphoribosylglycinamide formyltransferase [Thermospira aquatica]
MIFRRKHRLVILISGRGSNMKAILEAVKKKEIPHTRVVGVISDNPDAEGLTIARRYGVRALYLSAAPYKTKLEGPAEEVYIRTIKRMKPDLIVLAGFMRVVKPRFIQSFPNKIINIHPSLLPAYPGLHTHERVLAAGEKESGCTVHFVNEKVDGGKRIIQARVQVLPGDTPQTLAARVLEKEHKILPYAIRLLLEKKISYDSLVEPIQWGEEWKF